MTIFTTGLTHRWPGGIIPYEIDDGDFPDPSTERQMVCDAIDHWNECTFFSLIPRDPASHKDFVVFQEHAASCQTDVGRQGTGGQAITCDLNSGDFNKGSVIHEIGHSIGLFHEHTRPDRDNFVDYIEANVDTATYGSDIVNNFTKKGASDVVVPSQYDFRSVMHYRTGAFAKTDSSGSELTTLDVKPGHGHSNSDIGNKTALSELDVQAANFIVGYKYPMAALNDRLYMVHGNGNLYRVNPSNLSIEDSDKNWGGLAAICALGGRLFIVQNGHLHRVNPTDLSIEQHVASWDGEVKMATIGNRLYIIQNGHLHRVNPDDLSIEQHVASWDSPSTMIAMGNRLFITQNSHLHRVNPVDLSIDQHDSSWDGPVEMVGHGNRLYIIQNGHLHRVNPDNLVIDQHVPTWEGPSSIAANGNRLYIIQNSHIHRVKPDDLSIEQHEDTWGGPTVMVPLGNKLYVVQNSHLHRINPGDLSIEQHVANWW